MAIEGFNEEYSAALQRLGVEGKPTKDYRIDAALQAHIRIKIDDLTGDVPRTEREKRLIQKRIEILRFTQRYGSIKYPR